MHIRRQFIDDMKLQLGLIPGFSGVWNQRTGPARRAFPGITLYSSDEEVDTLTIHPAPRIQDRDLTVLVNAWFKVGRDDEKAECDMDHAAELIEKNLTVPKGADDMTLVSTTFQVSEEDAELHSVTLAYQITYTTAENNPTTI